LKKIAIFFGGKSQEHDVSVITGVLTLNSLDKTKFEGVPVYIDKDGLWWTGECLKNIGNFRDGDLKGLKRVTLLFGDDTLYFADKKLKPYCVLSGAINCTHGRNGEDGTIAAVLRLCNVPLASPDVFCSALAMDKDFTKTCLAALGVRTAEGVTITRKQYYSDKTAALNDIERLSYPVIIKPCSSWSSIGISVADDRDKLIAALDTAFTFDVKAVAEKFIENAVDINCACYTAKGKTVVSECEKAVGGRFLSFADKYLGGKGGGERVAADNLDEQTKKYIKDVTALIYQKFGFSGIIRIDYLVSGNDVYLNEINSVPGSLAYYLFCDKIGEFTDLLTDLLTESFSTSREYLGCRFTFSSNVLALGGVSIKK